MGAACRPRKVARLGRAHAGHCVATAGSMMAYAQPAAPPSASASGMGAGRPGVATAAGHGFPPAPRSPTMPSWRQVMSARVRHRTVILHIFVVSDTVLSGGEITRHSYSSSRAGLGHGCQSACIFEAHLIKACINQTFHQLTMCLFYTISVWNKHKIICAVSTMRHQEQPSTHCPHVAFAAAQGCKISAKSCSEALISP